ncbi:MAG: alpha-L-fucosidase [Tannerellaceae bacterium]|jgi:alpha-L-fucosidase|nr:alpha-L-fucosidase [Tannerellaceae bacterium]
MRNNILTYALLLGFLLVLPSGIWFSCSQGVKPPEAYGVVPTEHQLKWQQMEYYMFVHFGPNTFTEVEWGDGKEDPGVFNPSALDCRQWAATARAAGMKGIILTAKHHDGFCLWPSQYSTHTVRESGWKDGKGDVVRELSEACKAYGLAFGVYLSPWDQNHPSYGTPEYNEVFARTLTEVLSGYGPVFEQWFDGANGDAHKGKRQVYDWDLFHQTVYAHQPQAVIFSDVGPGCRWMGNERGVAGETNWSRLHVEGFEPGLGAPPADTLATGNIDGEAWVPAETDVSIRPGWFYSAHTDDQVKSVSRLVDIYYTSIGRNSNLLLNVPPNREGRIHPTDSARLMAFRKAIEESFAHNLLDDAILHAPDTRGGAAKYAAKNLLDEDYDSYWASDDEVLTTSIEISLPEAARFNRFLVQEYIPLGQRVARFALESWDEAAAGWNVISEGTTIGYKRILRFPRVKAQKLRLHILSALASPVLNRIGLYDAPDIYEDTRQETDQTLIKALRVKWSIESPKGETFKSVIDGDAQTTAVIRGLEPLILNLGEKLRLRGVIYVPADKATASHITRYNLSVSLDGKQWTKVKQAAVFHNIKNNPIPQDVRFDPTEQAQFIKLEPLETTTPDGDAYSIAELSLIL